MSHSVFIQNREIGSRSLPLVIPEIGINHGGSLEVAKLMVLAAVRAGAEVIKHQTHMVSDEMSEAAKKVRPGNADKSIFEVMASCALSENDEAELKHFTEKQGLIFLSTPFSRAAADFLQELGVVAFKIGSGECNNLPLIKHICGFGKPLLISTGMNDLDSVRRTVELVKSFSIPLVLLHTTNLYPTPHHLVRYGGMQQLMEAFPEIPIGLSDHTLNNNACIGAVALGASVLERHFTDTLHRVGPDISCSMDEAQLSCLIKSTREVYLCRGGSKDDIIDEDVTRNFAFATVVSIKAISEGHELSKENIWVKRPGTGGIPAAQFEEVLGKRARRNIAVDEHLSFDDLY
jgi:N-acetylneuraminate synthase